MVVGFWRGEAVRVFRGCVCEVSDVCVRVMMVLEREGQAGRLGAG